MIKSLILISVMGIFTLSCSCSKNENETLKEPESKTVNIKVGTREVITNKFTNEGFPVVSMWDVPMPTADYQNGAGCEILTQADHQIVWQPKVREDGAFNHSVALVYFHNKFFAMWSNHLYGEDAPGQRIIFTQSDKWGSWADVEELFPAPCPVARENEVNKSSSILTHLTPDRWAVIDDNLYAIVYVLNQNGTGRYPIARQVNDDGAFGEPLLVKTLPEGMVLPEFMNNTDSNSLLPIAHQIEEWYVQNDLISQWAGAEDGVRRPSIDDKPLIESFSYRAKDNGLVLMLRSHGYPSWPVHNNRLYVSFSDSARVWNTPYPTDIPDSPSRSEAVKLDNGTILLIGNQIAYKLDHALYLKRDPLTVTVSEDGYKFNKAFALRVGAPQTYRFEDIDRRVIGFQYPSSVIQDGWLYTAYSVNKEEIGITRVKLSEIL